LRRVQIKSALQSVRQQTVDGGQAALEIQSRSSYVPNAHRRLVAAIGDAPSNSTRALGMLAWMK
jgi:hypothetical protein